MIKPVATVRERLEGRGALMNIAHEVTELTDTLEIVFQEKPKATEVLIIVTTPSGELVKNIMEPTGLQFR